MALVAVFLAAVFGLAAAVFAAGLPSLTGPEGPLGRAKTPLSEPLDRAALKRALKVASVMAPRLLLARTYFFSVWREDPLRSLSYSDGVRDWTCWNERKRCNGWLRQLATGGKVGGLRPMEMTERRRRPRRFNIPE